MIDFNVVWINAIQENNVSGELADLVRNVYDVLLRKPLNLVNVQNSLETLLSFLATKEGKTDANCRSVDIFFCLINDGELSDFDLPRNLKEILEDIGGALHDTVSNTKVAENFESTPEQLLERLRKINNSE